MKKFAILLFVLLPLLYSCSSEDSAASEPGLTTNGTKLRRVTGGLVGGSTLEGSNYIYNGNKLLKIQADNGDHSDYTYTGNLITKIETTLNNVMVETTLFVYNSNEQLIKSTSLNYSSNNGYKTIFTHNSDNTITMTSYSGDFINQNTVGGSKKAYLVNGQVDKIEEYVVIGGVSGTRTANYTYDNKNNPYNSILGYNKLTRYDTGLVANIHNATSYIYSASVTTNIDMDDVTYTYNSFDYPITQTYIDPGDTGGSSEVFYFFYEAN